MGGCGQGFPLSELVSVSQHHGCLQEPPRPDITARLEELPSLSFNAACRTPGGDDLTSFLGILKPAIC